MQLKYIRVVILEKQSEDVFKRNPKLFNITIVETWPAALGRLSRLHSGRDVNTDSHDIVAVTFTPTVTT